MNQQLTPHSRQTRAGSQKFMQTSVLCLLFSVFCLLATGCVRRTLTIRSEPDGAELLVNDKRLGTTPYSYDFVWYGWHRITLRKPGYEQLDDRVLIKTPLSLWTPFDLVMELAPWTVKDAKELSYQLTPQIPLVEPRPPQPPASSETSTTPTPMTPAEPSAPSESSATPTDQQVP